MNIKYFWTLSYKHWAFLSINKLSNLKLEKTVCSKNVLMQHCRCSFFFFIYFLSESWFFMYLLPVKMVLNAVKTKVCMKLYKCFFCFFIEQEIQQAVYINSLASIFAKHVSYISPMILLNCNESNWFYFPFWPSLAL